MRCFPGHNRQDRAVCQQSRLSSAELDDVGRELDYTDDCAMNFH